MKYERKRSELAGNAEGRTYFRMFGLGYPSLRGFGFWLWQTYREFFHSRARTVLLQKFFIQKFTHALKPSRVIEGGARNAHPLPLSVLSPIHPINLRASIEFWFA